MGPLSSLVVTSNRLPVVTIRLYLTVFAVLRLVIIICIKLKQMLTSLKRYEIHNGYRTGQKPDLTCGLSNSLTATVTDRDYMIFSVISASIAERPSCAAISFQ